MKSTNKFFILFFLVLLLASFSKIYGQNTTPAMDSMTMRIQKIGRYYQANEFEKGLEMLEETYKIYYKKANDKFKSRILELGIKLSFALDRRVVTQQYLKYYYEFSPSFSSKDLPQINLQLAEFIGEYIDSQNETSIFVNKNPQNIDLVPATVTVYTQEDIEELGARDLLDLIRITPGFSELGDNNERLFGTRGTSNTTLQDVLFLINGHRIADMLTNSNAPDWISLKYVDQVEIVRGPGSALYGGTAFSGVVNIITKTGRKEDLINLSVGMGNGNSLRDIGKDFNSYNIHYEWAKRIGNIEGIYLSASYYQSGGSEIDYSQSNSRPVLPDLNGTTILRAADTTGIEYINRYGPGYNILLNYSKKSLQITANAQQSSYIFSRPSSLNIWNSFDQDSLRKQRRRIDSRQFVQLEYDLLSNTGSDNQLRLKVGADHFHKDFSTPAYSYGIIDNTQLIGDEYRGTFNLEYSSDKIFSGAHERTANLLIGVEGFVNNWFYKYLVEEDTSLVLSKLSDQFSINPTDSRNEYIAAAFIQTEQHLVEDKLIATAGIRFNYHNEYSTFNTFVWGKQYSPRIALIYLPKKNKPSAYKFKLLYNTAFLPPPFLYRRGGIRRFSGSTNLNSQTIESGELVMYGDLSEKFTYSILTFANKIEGSISRSAVNDGTYFNELADKRISGYEGELHYKQTSDKLDISAFANFSFTKQHDFNDSTNHRYFSVFNSSLYSAESSLVRFPKSHVNLGMNVALKKLKLKTDNNSGDKKYSFKLAFGANAQLIGKTRISSIYFLDASGSLQEDATGTPVLQDLPAAVVINGRVKAYWDQFSIGASVYNLTNKEYYLPSAVSSIQRKRAEGRMIYLDLSYSFN